MFCSRCGRLTLFKRICQDCVQNELLFQGLSVALDVRASHAESLTAGGVLGAVLRFFLSRA